MATHTFIRAKVGNGVSVRFWLDIWLGDTALRNKWPLLYRLEGYKTCSVADRTKREGNKLVIDAEWINNIQTAEELVQWVNMCEAVDCYNSSMGQDGWIWDVEGQSEFSVKGVAALLLQRYGYGSNFVIKWLSWVPLKCSIMAWRAEMNRIPTKEALAHRNIVIQDTSCSWCRATVETEVHVLVGCFIAANVWDRISTWCRIPPIFAFSIQDLLQLYKTGPGCKMKKKILHGIVMVSMWAIWKARNDTIFNGAQPSVELILSSVKSLSFLWFKNRTKCNRLVWKDWCRFPMYML